MPGPVAVRKIGAGYHNLMGFLARKALENGGRHL